MFVTPAGQVELSQELNNKAREFAELAREARQRANKAAYDSSNLGVLNRHKVSAQRVGGSHLAHVTGVACQGMYLREAWWLSIGCTAFSFNRLLHSKRACQQSLLLIHLIPGCDFC